MIEDIKQLKKDVVKDWLQAIPTLMHYSSNKLYRVTGCVVIGLELIRGPWSPEYRPHFVMYPLWKEDIKKCMEYPIVMCEFYNKKNLQFNIPYDKHAQYYEEAVESVKKTKPVLFNNDVSFYDIMAIIDEHTNYSYLKASPNSHLQAQLQELKIEMALCYGNIDMAHQIIKLAKNRNWDFKYSSIEPSEWLLDIEQIPNNIDAMLFNLETNKKDKKILKLL